MSRPDAIVVGAGIVGAACAEALAKDGRRVLVLEFLFGWPDDTVRPPLYPTPYGALKENRA